MSNLNNFLEGIEKEINSEPEAQVEDTKVEDAEDVKETATVEEGSPSEPEKVEDSSKVEHAEEDPKKVPLKALEEERHKRQELERQLESLKNQPQPKAEEKIDFLENPEGRLDQVSTQMQQQLLLQKIQMSEHMVKQQHNDYDDKMNRFMMEAQKSPSLIDNMKAHPHPAQFAYETAAKYIQLDEINDLDSYKQTLSEKIRKEIEAEYEAKNAGKKTKAAALPEKSLADTGSAKLDEKGKAVNVDDFIKSNSWRRK